MNEPTDWTVPAEDPFLTGEPETFEQVTAIGPKDDYFGRIIEAARTEATWFALRDLFGPEEATRLMKQEPPF
jgi:hypothetical protein